jgi:hypothetical protein
MTTDDAHTIRGDIRELREAVATVEKLQREANTVWASSRAASLTSSCGVRGFRASPLRPASFGCWPAAQ